MVTGSIPAYNHLFLIFCVTNGPVTFQSHRTKKRYESLELGSGCNMYDSPNHHVPGLTAKMLHVAILEKHQQVMKPLIIL